MRRWTFPLALSLFAAGSLAAQETGRITGRVTEAGRPIGGAYVVVENLAQGTLSQPDGTYVIPNVPPGTRTVRVALLGYADQTKQVTVAAGQTATVDFGMSVAAVELEGIVAVGYGTQERRQLTGAVASVRADRIAEIATADVVKAIQGRVAGVEVVSASNLPGAPMNIRIRGVRSLTASNEPLYVVDGVPISGGISDFSPDFIHSIEILKDAAATAIYGSGAANGVVLITTKTGADVAAGTGLQTQFTMDAYTGMQRPLQLVEMMNMQEYTTMLQAAARWAGLPDDVNSVLGTNEMRAAYNAGVETDWQREILRTGRQNSFQLGMSGMTGNTRFNISGSYFDQQGLAAGQEYSRGTAVVSLAHSLSRLNVGVTATGSRSITDQGAGNGLWGYALAQTGFGKPFTDDGLLDIAPDGEVNAVNPVRAQNLFFNQITRNRLLASMFADFEIADGLNFRVNFGPDLTMVDNGTFAGPATTYPKTGDSRAELTKDHSFTYVFNNILTGRRNFGENHQLDVTMLYAVQKNRFNQEFAAAERLPYDEQLWYNLGSGSAFRINSNLSEWALQSYMGRVNYTLFDRYTVSATMRRDGSSRLAPGHKWTNFPSVGAAWQIGDEEFMANVGFVDALKLRASYGVTGNTSVAPYQTQGALSFLVYNWGDNYTYGYGPNDSNPANPLLSWEKSVKTNFGLDFGLFGSRVTGSLDYYIEDTEDLIMRQSLPRTSGYSSALLNIGETKNSGLEIQLSTLNVSDWNGVRWTTDFAWAHNSNEITKLANANTVGCPDNLPCDRNNRWFVGQPITIGAPGQNNRDMQRQTFFDYRKIGIWQSNEAAEAASYGFRPGEIKIFDANGDGSIDADDMVLLGSTYPKWTGSIYNRFTWKTFDLSALATIKWGYTIFDSFGSRTNTMMGRFGNIRTEYWTEENPSTTQPAPRISGNEVRYADSRAYLDASHWRVRNVTLGYTMPVSLTDRFGANRLRLYATAQDPFFVSDYKGYDPENGTAGGAPAYRTLLIGANVTW